MALWLEKTADFAQRGLLWLMLLFSGCAICWSKDAWDPFLASEPGLSGLFAVTMFFIGCLMPREEVDQLFRQWPSVLIGTAIQYVSMPLLAFLMGRAFGLEGAYLIGVTLVGCVPGAMASNVITMAAKGNVSYSVSLTTSATVLSPFVVPFVLNWTLGAENKIDALAVMIKLLWQVVGPVILGHLVCRFWPRFATQLRSASRLIANGTIIWIIAVVVALNRGRLLDIDGSVDTTLMLLALLALNLCGYLAGYFGGTVMRIAPDMRRALSLEVGMQNAGLGTLLALDLFHDQPDAAIPTAVYTFGCMVTGIALAKWWGRARNKVTDESGAADSGEQCGDQAK